MVWVSWILLGLSVLLVIIILTKITVFVDLRHAKENDYYRVTFTAWFRFIRYTYEIPVVKIQKDSPTLLVEEKQGFGEDGKEKKDSWKDYSIDDGFSFLEGTKQFLEHVTNFYTIVKNFLRHVSIRELKWHTRVGVGDAALTAITVGAIWAGKGSVIGIISRYMKLKDNPTLTVVPVFQKVWSETVFQCIISFRCGQAILVGLRLLKHWRRTSKSYKSRNSVLEKNKTHSAKT
ncbi:DUF2953 domain-containing protein [Priestia megaterium]|nr:DUF2953 domain-containing protein [Priestia megaterium]